MFSQHNFCERFVTFQKSILAVRRGYQPNYMSLVKRDFKTEKQEKNAKHIGFYFLKHNCLKPNKHTFIV